ncbi:PspC domain-containing protein [Nocardiopsis lambiniae]|uniref:PspC domain-containing protein n=1 Tax=Nocardiopsis lambiniae TaxID=3075539 RepID=A0ABU2MDF5_9ACTN|nr:PspC domain-containing protein [Nocardiopsis sp. DSM 44743]MDT0330713.1 PspC domain-containing protein [Nocardiopsis sp. DSM 44743]
MSEGPVPQGSGAPGSSADPTPVRELRKADGDRVLAGVCAGLGHYTDVDPVVWRAAFALTAFAGGTGVLLYLAAWMLMRDAQGGPATIEQMLDRGIPSRAVLKLLALGLAVATAFSLVGGFGWSTLVLAVPLVLGVLAARGRGVDLRTSLTGLGEELRAKRPPPQPPVPGPVPTYYNPAQPWASAPAGPVDLAVVAERTLRDREPGPGGDEEDEGPGDAAGRPEPSGDQACRRGFPLGSCALWTLVTAAVLAPIIVFERISSLWSADTARLLLGPETGVFFLAGGLGLVGLFAVVGTWVGNPRGLGFLGVLLTLALVTVSTVDVTRMRIGEEVWRPTTVAAAEAGEHRLTMGDVTVDLTALEDLEPGEGVDVSAGVGAGRVLLVLPDDARVELTATFGAGVLQGPAPAGDEGGSARDRFGFSSTFEEDYGPARETGDDEVPLIRVDTDTRVGVVEVLHGEA